MLFSRTRVLPVLLLALAGAGLVALESPAHAAGITTTNITTPVDGTHYAVTTFTSIPTTTVTGTTDGTTGDHVDIRCYEVATSQWQPGPFNVPVQADHTFSVQMSIDVPYGTCQLLAVPAGWPRGSSIAGFTGPRVTAEFKRSSTYASGPSAGKIFDFALAYQGSNALFDITSATHAGYWESRLNFPDGSSSNYFWDSDSASLRADAGEARSRIRIDGRNAYGPFSASSQNLGSAIPGRPSLTWSVTRDGTTGVTRVSEKDPLVACPKGAPYPATLATCPKFSSLGVRLERSYVITDGGRQVHLTDVWRSTDGKSHVISAQYANQVHGHNYVSDADTDVALRLPWLGGPETFTGEATYARPTKLASSIYVWDSISASDPNTLLPRGAVTFDFPASVHRTAYNTFVLQAKTFTVPANSSRMLRESYVIGASNSEIQGKAAANRTRINPWRPDGLIKLVGRSFRGNNIYNTTGAGQTVEGGLTYLIAIQNDGTRTDSFRVRGGGAVAGFTVSYFAGTSGGTSITSAVEHGTFAVRNLAPGAKRYIRLIVRPHGLNGQVGTWPVTLTSLTDTTRKDVVKARVHMAIS